MDFAYSEAYKAKIEALIRPEILEMESHLPGDSLEVASRRIGLTPQDIIKLDANENPYGCSVQVQELLASFDAYHLYPDTLMTGLRSRLEEYSGIRKERIMLTNGVSELTDLVMRVFVRPGDEVIVCPPTVQFYRFYAQLAGARVLEVARHPQNFTLQTDDILQTVERSGRVKLIVVGSPNNPTGNVVGPTELIKLLNTEAIVLVDESFYEFAGTSVAGLVNEYDNLVVMRSFSHWAGLAGMRVAYGLFSQPIIAQVWKLRAAYKVDAAQQLAVEAVLSDQRYYENVLNWLRTERGRLYRQLRKLNFLHPFPSQANFILAQVVRGSNFQIKRQLDRQGIFVRQISSPELPNHLRITVGRPEDTDALMQSLLAIAEEL